MQYETSTLWEILLDAAAESRASMRFDVLHKAGAIFDTPHRRDRLLMTQIGSNHGRKRR